MGGQAPLSYNNLPWKFNLNAPRQGLFASLLAISFISHSVLIVFATNYYLKDNRMIQGESLTRQLVQDSQNELAPPNPVALALLASRYATNPNIAALRILDRNNQVLATAGANKTRQGDVFLRDAVSNEQTIGKVEVTLVVPSLGEHLRNLWLPVLITFLIHTLIWLCYRFVARPTRQEFLDKMKQEAYYKHEIQRLTEEIQQTKHETNLALAKAKQLAEQNKQQRVVADVNISSPLQPNKLSQQIFLSLQFFDPKNLLSSISPSTAQSYFNLAQLCLNKAIEQCTQHFQLSSNQFDVIQPFLDDGALVCVNNKDKKTIRALVLVTVVFQLLSDSMYRRLREEKRFALQTRCAIAEELPAMQLTAEKTAVRLGQCLHAKETAIYLSKPSFKECRHHYELYALPNPSNPLTRDSTLILGLSTKDAEIAKIMRQNILLGQNKPI